ncbi:uncharacterized protein LOC110856298 [Folsomia candida]|uniref:uncharacterized protein LOC110856298 n=1 Tax=Folsomia candida TaxID=158441 RepID=UPI000B904A6D|nr:uncharacterized protein LOC110856298 [Folsomia candida]
MAPHFALLLVIAVVTNLIPQSKSEHPKFEECKKASERYFKASHKNTMACHADLKDDTHSLEEKFDKFGCTVRCILQKDKMLDDNEAVTEEFLKSNYKGRVISEFDEKLLSHFLECKTKFGDKLDKADPNCKSYRDYGLCMQESISHVCYENP